MFEKFQGAQAMSTEPVGYHIPFIPCQAHQLNIFVKFSCERSIVTCEHFSKLKTLYVFFYLSTKWSCSLDKTLTNIEESLEQFLSHQLKEFPEFLNL